MKTEPTTPLRMQEISVATNNIPHERPSPANMPKKRMTVPSSAILEGLKGATYTSEGVTPHEQTARDLPPLDTNFHALGGRLSEESREKLSDVYAALLADAESQGIDVSQEELQKSFPLVDFEVPISFATGSRVYITEFDEDATETDDRKEETESLSSGQSFKGAYLTKVFLDTDESPTGMIAAPVPYVPGNAIFVARADAHSLDGLSADLLRDPELTKKLLQDLTGAVKITHQGDPEKVQKRVKAALTEMPAETFLAGPRARQRFYEQAYTE